MKKKKNERIEKAYIKKRIKKVIYVFVNITTTVTQQQQSHFTTKQL